VKAATEKRLARLEAQLAGRNERRNFQVRFVSSNGTKARAVGEIAPPSDRAHAMSKFGTTQN